MKIYDIEALKPLARSYIKNGIDIPCTEFKHGYQNYLRVSSKIRCTSDYQCLVGDNEFDLKLTENERLLLRCMTAMLDTGKDTVVDVAEFGSDMAEARYLTSGTTRAAKKRQIAKKLGLSKKTKAPDNRPPAEVVLKKLFKAAEIIRRLIRLNEPIRIDSDNRVYLPYFMRYLHEPAYTCLEIGICDLADVHTHPWIRRAYMTTRGGGRKRTVDGIVMSVVKYQHVEYIVSSDLYIQRMTDGRLWLSRESLDDMHLIQLAMRANGYAVHPTEPFPIKPDATCWEDLEIVWDVTGEDNLVMVTRDGVLVDKADNAAIMISNIRPRSLKYGIYTRRKCAELVLGKEITGPYVVNDGIWDKEHVTTG